MHPFKRSVLSRTYKRGFLETKSQSSQYCHYVNNCRVLFGAHPDGVFCSLPRILWWCVRWYSPFRTQMPCLGNAWLLRFRLDTSDALTKRMPRIRYFVGVRDQRACLKQSKLGRIDYILASVMRMPFLRGKLSSGLPPGLLTHIPPALMRWTCWVDLGPEDSRAPFPLGPSTHSELCLLDESIFKTKTLQANADFTVWEECGPEASLLPSGGHVLLHQVSGRGLGPVVGNAALSRGGQAGAFPFLGWHRLSLQGRSQ